MNTKVLNVWGQITIWLYKVLSMVVLMLAASSSALAINLGNLNIISGKFTPFAATIIVEDYDSADINKLQVSLASQETYDRLGIPLSTAIKKLKFSPQLSAGIPIIKISSDEVLRQSEYKLALEVGWPQRKYTFLYDMKIPQPSVEELAVYQAEQAAAEAAVAAKQEHAQQPSAEHMPSAQEHTTVTVRDGITLWRIASHALPSQDVSVNQMMLAILALNPDSFEFNNVNSLKAKTELKIPHRVDLEYTKQQAEYEIMRQHEEWERGKDTVKKPASALDSEIFPGTKAHTIQIDYVSSENADVLEQNMYPETGSYELAYELENEHVEEIELSQPVTDSTQQYQPAEVEPLPDWQQLPTIDLPADAAAAKHSAIDVPDVKVRASQLDVLADSLANTLSDGSRIVLTHLKDVSKQLQFDNFKRASIDYWQQHQQLLVLLLFIIVMLLLGYRLGRDKRENSTDDGNDQFANVLTARESIISEINARRGLATESGAVAAADQVTQANDFTLDSVAQSDQRSILDEVNIYLSYGLYLEAVDLLSKTLEKSPDHVGYLLKLAETHCLAENPQDFLNQAEKLSKLVERDSLAWKKLAGFAESILPKHDLFTDPEQPHEDVLQEFNAAEFELENLTQTENSQQQNNTAEPDDAYGDDFDTEDNSTKLDLAKVYIDMGDIEAARDILLSVIKEGTPEQREEANKLSMKIT